jgi:hypothetical protein
VCTADLGFTGGKNDIGAGTDTDFIGACTPALTVINSLPAAGQHYYCRYGRHNFNQEFMKAEVLM